MNYSLGRKFRFVFAIVFASFFATPFSFAKIENGLNPTEMREFERELEDAARDIDDYVSSLSQEQQDEFKLAVEEVSQMIEDMDPEEFDKFLGEMFAEEAGKEVPVEEVVEPEVVEEVKPTEPVVPEISPEERKKQEYAISMIDTIIMHTNSFLRKVQSSPELPGKIEQWGKQGKIKEWPATLVWADFKTKLEEFNKRLYRLKEKDSKQVYKYIADLIADETLFNTIDQLRRKLVQHEPKIEIPEFALQKLNATSKRAVQNAASSYTESFYILKINEGIDAVFEKYEPHAEKLRKEEEAAIKRAEAAAGKTRVPGRVVKAGIAPEEAYEYYREPGYDYGDYDYGVSTPTYEAPRFKPERPERARKPRERKPGTPKEAKPDKELEALARRAEIPKDLESETLLTKIQGNFDVIDEILKKDKLEKFEEHLITADKPVDEDLVVETIPTLKRHIAKATDNIKALNTRVSALTARRKTYYKKRLEIESEKYTKQFFSFIETIEIIKEKMSQEEFKN